MVMLNGDLILKKILTKRMRYFLISMNILIKANLAMGNTVRLLADGHTFGAVFGFTGLVGAFNLVKNKYKDIKSNTSQSGFSHLTSQTAFLGSWQEVWHLGGSQTGSQMAGHLGSSHFQAHSG